MIKNIIHDDKLMAIIIKSDFKSDGLHFFTPDNFSQQLAYMCHPAGKIIDPHIHNQVQREIFYTQEALFLKKGRLRVDFYDDNKSYLKSIIMETGDIILLATGGHGFETLEETEIIEVKQGPYAGDKDKTRFKSIDDSKIIIED